MRASSQLLTPRTPSKLLSINDANEAAQNGLATFDRAIGSIDGIAMPSCPQLTDLVSSTRDRVAEIVRYNRLQQITAAVALMEAAILAYF